MIGPALTTRKNGNFGVTALLGVLGLLVLYPLLVTLSNSFMSESELTVNYSARPLVFDILEGTGEPYARMSLVPRRFSAEQYAQVLVKQPSFLVLLFNSLTITVPVVLGNLLVSLAAAYGFTRSRWKYRELLFRACVVVMLLPLQALLVPNYIIASRLGIRESYLAIILPGIFSPFGMFLLRQNLKAFPPSYFEAAEMDGAGHLRVILRIVAPQMKSSAAALCMLTFVDYWNLVEQAVVFITDYTKEPLSVYLSRLAEGRVALIFAASAVYMLPPLWFLFTGQDDLEKGIEMSGVK